MYLKRVTYLTERMEEGGYYGKDADILIVPHGTFAGAASGGLRCSAICNKSVCAYLEV
jgi:hypothetical protein